MNKTLKVAIIGAGSSYTPELIDGLISRSKELPISEVRLVDIDEGWHKAEVNLPPAKPEAYLMTPSKGSSKHPRCYIPIFN